MNGPRLLHHKIAFGTTKQRRTPERKIVPIRLFGGAVLE